MRKILFKGKSTRDGNWYEGYLYHDKEGYYIIPPKIEPVDENTVGEYVGVDDINGKRIFEGDVVKARCKYEDWMLSCNVVEWRESDASFCLRKEGRTAPISYFTDIEVAGNIHDELDGDEENEN